MIITKQNRRLIYENLFKGESNKLNNKLQSRHLAFLEGVLVAKKDYNAPKHEELDVPNLQVIKALQSLTSRGLVKTQFSWQYYYYVLTPEGVEKLRTWSEFHFFFFNDQFLRCSNNRLNLPAEIVPATHKKAPRPARSAAVRPGGGEGTYRPPRGERDGYRRKDEGPPGDFRPSYSAGVGRGGPRE